jgi:copper(I)-binding protein
MVQNILGDRMGSDVFFYSISIDPEHDTVPVLKEYRERFGAEWTFLTGNKAEIINLRRKLGLYIEEIQDGSNNHNVSMIIGNQATGRWMKRSPFENPYVLADQIGNWLTGWKAKPSGESYANAPKLRNIPRGEQLYRTRCTTCHSITGNELANALGPDLLGVTQRREKAWLLNWLRAPDQMLEQRDPIAVALYKQYNKLAMPNMRLNQQEATDLLTYIKSESKRLNAKALPTISAASATKIAPKSADDVLNIMNAWVRDTDNKAKVNAAYMTLANESQIPVKLVKMESKAFEQIEMHEMTTVDGMMSMREFTDLVIPANGDFRFAPGGSHLMLKKPRRNLAAGQKVEITLTFDSGKQQTVSVIVANR